MEDGKALQKREKKREAFAYEDACADESVEAR